MRQQGGSRGRRAVEIPADTLTVTLPDGSTIPAQIIAQDNERDLAAIRIDAHDLPIIQPGDSQSLHAGQWVFAIGHPWGILGAASAGVVIGSGSEWPDMPTNGREWVVTSLKVRPGNSGGPLVDTQGRLVGVNTLMTGPGIGAAVPVQTIKHFLKEALGERTANAIAQVTRVV
jgi:S1-C subfamily serine protease